MAANLKAKISLDTSAFSRGISKVSADVARVAGSIARTGAMMGAALSGAAFTGLAVGVKGALALGDSLANLSARTGAPIKDLMLLQEAFKQADIGAEGVGPAINKMQKALTGVNEQGEPTNKMFGQLGLKIEDLKKKSPAQQFEQIGKAIMQLADPADRAAASMAIFGRSGGELMQVFSNPQAMQEAGKALGGQAEIMAKNAATFGRVSDQLEQVGTKLMGFFAGVTESVLPALESAGNFIASLDLAPIGKRLGDALQSGINIVVNAFKQGELGNLLSLTIQLGAMKGVDFLISAFAGLASVIQEVLGQAFAVLFEASFWDAMVQGFIAAANTMAAAFIKIMTGPLKAIQDSMTFLFEKVLSGGRGGRSFAQIQKEDKLSLGGISSGDLEKNAKNATDKAGQALYDLSQKGILSATEIKKAFMDSFGKGGIFGDQIKATEAELMALAKKLNVPIGEVKAAIEGTAGKNKLPPPDKEEKFRGIPRVEAASALERIGAMMGGGGPSAALANNTRETATNTRKIAVYMEKLVSMGGPATEPTGAVYA
jgi:hypothetical protein